MTAIQVPVVFWFPSLGFRPGEVKARKDFVGDVGTKDYVFLLGDAHLPYSQKYDGPHVPVEFISWTGSEAPIPYSPPPFLKPAPRWEPPVFFWPPTFCCSLIPEPPVPTPPVAPIPVVGTGLLMLTVVSALILKKVFA